MHKEKFRYTLNFLLYFFSYRNNLKKFKNSNLLEKRKFDQIIFFSNLLALVFD